MTSKMIERVMSSPRVSERIFRSLMYVTVLAAPLTPRPLPFTAWVNFRSAYAGAAAATARHAAKTRCFMSVRLPMCLPMFLPRIFRKYSCKVTQSVPKLRLVVVVTRVHYNSPRMHRQTTAPIEDHHARGGSIGRLGPT